MGDVSDWILRGFWDGQDNDPEPNCNSIPSAYEKWMELSESEIREIIADAKQAGYKGDSQFQPLVDSILSRSVWSEKQKKCLWMHFKRFVGDSLLYRTKKTYRGGHATT